VEETRSLIAQYFDAFNRKDVGARLALLDEHVVHHINQGGTETGRTAFAEFIEAMDARYREQIEDLVIMTEGDRGTAEFMVRGEYLQTDPGFPAAHGQPYAIPAAAIFTVRDGKIIRVTSYYNVREWIAAVSNPTVSA
jgi:steroid delta-isomerase-like uncharacterized protein